MEPLVDTDLEAAEVIMSALDSRLRIQIVLRLAQRDHFVHELVAELNKSQPLVSQHLRVLKRAGVVDSERRGREVIYRLGMPEVTKLIDIAAELGKRPRVRHEGALAVRAA